MGGAADLKSDTVCDDQIEVAAVPEVHFVAVVGGGEAPAGRVLCVCQLCRHVAAVVVIPQADKPAHPALALIFQLLLSFIIFITIFGLGI
jgi:hypothetical protein